MIKTVKPVIGSSAFEVVLSQYKSIYISLVMENETGFK